MVFQQNNFTRKRIIASTSCFAKPQEFNQGWRQHVEEGLEKIYSFNVFNVEHRLNFLPSLGFLLSFVPGFCDFYSFQVSIYFFMNLREIILPNRFLRHLCSKSVADNRLETKTEENYAIQRSKPSGDYILIFSGPEGVLRKKTESGRHTRCPQATQARPGGRPRLAGLSPPRALSGLL